MSKLADLSLRDFLGCNEVVNWVVAKTSLKVTSYDLSKLRNLKSDDGVPIKRNYRDLQNLGQRTVYDVVVNDAGETHIYAVPEKFLYPHLCPTR